MTALSISNPISKTGNSMNFLQIFISFNQSSLVLLFDEDGGVFELSEAITTNNNYWNSIYYFHNFVNT